MSAPYDVRAEARRFLKAASEFDEASERGDFIEMVAAMDEIETISKEAPSPALPRFIAAWLEARDKANRAKQRAY